MIGAEQQLSEANAYSKEECLHVALLPAAPSKENSDKLLYYNNEKVRCVINGREVYLLFYESSRTSKRGTHLKNCRFQQLSAMGIPSISFQA
ncbi:hypothetical protein MKZ02_11550 [Pseudobacillus sp. FSL P4-0506]|uniref:hypothetical protein n=1 Tax=unclassified Pseudobacillus TaxID=2619284 RepID=UPI0030FA600A